MQKTITVITALLLSLSLTVFILSCGDDSSTNPQSESFVISGRIVDSSGNGVENVMVSASGESTVTNAAGYYAIEELDSGTYTISYEKEGYTFEPASQQCTINDSDFELTTITATPTATPGKITITGQVIDENGNGLADTVVHISGGDADQTVTANSSGNYSFEGTTGTTYTLTYEKEDYFFIPSSKEVAVGGNDITLEEVLGKQSGDLPAGIAFVSISAVIEPYEISQYLSFTLSAYDMSNKEITNAQYAQYLTEALSTGLITVTEKNAIGASGEWTEKQYVDFSGSTCEISYTDGVFMVDAGMENRPVVEVTWYGAKAFANYYGLDLPTEMEWFYAAGAGRHFEYATTDGILSPENANYMNNVGHTTDVGSYPSNPFGLYDMSGNVWEWCHDWYELYSMMGHETKHDYAGPDSPPGIAEERSVRGGSWDGVNVMNPMCVFRGRLYATGGYSNLGFRVVRRPSSLIY